MEDNGIVTEIPFEQKISNITKKTANLLPFFISIAIAIWWIMQSSIDISWSDSEIYVKIGITVSTFAISLAFSSIIANGGFASAKQTKEWIDATKENIEAQKKALPYEKECNDYALQKRKQRLAYVRRRNLEEVYLKYEDFFDEKGHFLKPNIKLKRKQRKAVRKAVSLRIVMPKLFGSVMGDEVYYGLKKEYSQRSYEIKNNVKNVIFKALLCIVSANVVFAFVEISVNSLIYALFQLVLWGGKGVLERINNFNFIINKILPQVQNHTSEIEGFMASKEIKSEATQNGQIIA